MRRARRWRAAGGLALGGLIWTACFPTIVTVDVPPRSGIDGANPGKFVAGVHREDITPLPGMALGGYSIDGKIARGFWTRLYARALYLKDANGTPLVLISTDLGAIPGGLADEVARRLHKDHGMPWISREHVVVAGTHTHHGPGNFYTSALFNSMISPWTGFDRPLFDFLAQRIAFAAWKARAAAADAELLVTDAATLDVSKEWNLDGFFRNRSLPAFLLNPRAPKLLDTSLSPNCALWPDDPDTLDRPDTRACQAVRPRVELLAVRRPNGSQFLGVAAFVPVHATVLPSSLEVYSSDLFGVADALLENAASCPKLAAAPVVAFFNGAEGDVSPTWTQRHRDEVVDLGTRLATKVCALLDRMKLVDTTVSFRFARAPLSNQPFDGREPFLDASGNPATAARVTTTDGTAGAASVGGAEDGRSVLYKLLGHREGKTQIGRDDHGPKSPAGKVQAMGIDMNVTGFMRWTSPPPQDAPIGIYAIGGVAPNVVIATLPGEFTTQMGERVRQAVWSAIPTSLARPAKPEHVLLIGLANEYVGYFTTPEEYDAQHYEGAMTLYGPASGPFVARALAGLAASPGVVPAPTAWSMSYLPGPTRMEPAAKSVWGAPYAQDDGIAELISRSAPTGVEVRRDLPVFCWRDHLPRFAGGGGACQLLHPEAWVETKGANEAVWNRVDLAGGLEIVTLVTGYGIDGSGVYHSDWCAVWLGAPDHLEPSYGFDYRFRARSLDGSDPTSATFQLIDGNNDDWADARFLQHPTPPLDPGFPVAVFPWIPTTGQCRVPDPS